MKRIGLTFANFSGNALALMCGGSLGGSVLSVSSLHQNKRHILKEGKLHAGVSADTGKPITGISFGSAQWSNPSGQRFTKY